MRLIYLHLNDSNSSYVGSAGFKSWPEDRLPSGIYWQPLGTFTQVSEYYLKSGCLCFLSKKLQFTIQSISYNLTLFKVWVNGRARNWTSTAQRFAYLCTEYRETRAVFRKVNRQSLMSTYLRFCYMDAQSWLTRRKYFKESIMLNKYFRCNTFHDAEVSWKYSSKVL